jgi:hypothetical protein
MTVFQVWVEGYPAGDSAYPAQLLGVQTATTFREACDLLVAPLGNYDAALGLYWGRVLHETEAQARAAYG